MSTDYVFVCYTCKAVGPTFASSSGFYGYKVWDIQPDAREWLGGGQATGHHEHHDLRIVREHEAHDLADEWGEDE